MSDRHDFDSRAELDAALAALREGLGVEERVIMRDEVLYGEQRKEPRTALLVSLANACGMLAIPFDKRELRGRKQRLEQIAEGLVVGKAAQQAIAAATAAIPPSARSPAWFTGAAPFPSPAPPSPAC